VEDLNDFYPGDKYVDWVGLSVFQQLYPWAVDNTAGEFAGGTLRQIQDVLEFARQHDKPIMISESTPFGGVDLQDVVGEAAQEYLSLSNNNNNNTDSSSNNVWELWFQPTLDLIEQYDIGMWSYINCDWNSQPMWKGVGFGNTLLSSSEQLMGKWRRHVLENPRFLNNLECDRHHRPHKSSSLQSRSSTMIWSDDTSSFFMPFLWFALSAVIVAASCNWVCRIFKQQENGYTEVPEAEEEEEDEGLGEIRKRFGSSSRLDVDAEELLESSRS
jgi:hypothetical protein